MRDIEGCDTVVAKPDTQGNQRQTSRNDSSGRSARDQIKRFGDWATKLLFHVVQERSNECSANAASCERWNFKT